jgi:hypothetical protein
LLTGFSVQAHCALVRHGVWEVEAKDTLSSVLKAALPDEPLRQKRLKRLVPMINKQSFDKEGNLVVGQTLRLPGVKMPAAGTPQNSEKIGRVLVTNGQVTAKKSTGETRLLKRGGAVMQGDTVETDGARVQIRFTDGSLLALRPNTSFKIEEYNFSGQQDGSEKGIYNLLKGGFRTISGAIGKMNKKNYRVKTPVATIGIRGTHYGITLCSNNSCAGNGLEDGLYGGVVEGSIATTNDGGTHVFDNDQYFVISDVSSLAKELLGPPGVIFDDPDTPPAPGASDKAAKSTPTASGEPSLNDANEMAEQLQDELNPLFDGTTETPDIVTSFNKETGVSSPGDSTETTIPTLSHPTLDGAPAPTGTLLAISLASTGNAEAFSMVQNGDAQRINLGAVGSSSAVFVGASQLVSDNGTEFVRYIDTNAIDGNLLDRGTVSSVGISYGRWQNTDVSVSSIQGNSQVTASSTPPTGIHFATVNTDNAITTVTQFDNLDTSIGMDNQNYSVGLNFAGATSPTGLDGLTGTLVTSLAESGGTQLSINFVSNTITALSIDAALGMDYYYLESPGPIALTNILTPGSTTPLQGHCYGSNNCLTNVPLTGEASIIFGGSSGDFIGAAVNYSGQATDSTANPDVGISGVVVFDLDGPG